MEEDIEFLYRFDPRFPIDDVIEIGRRLTASKALVPGWIEPSVGAFDIRAVVVSKHYDGWSTILLPDRNIVSRMARVARDGTIGKRDHPMDIAVLLMAFAQAVDFNIEPGLAFHELAQRDTNQDALNELRWFRTADLGGRAQEWIDLALGRISTVAFGGPAPEESVNLSAPIRRWRCNYVAALKIAELELSSHPPFEKLMKLLDWMMSDFLLAAPALLFAARYWAPNLPRAGLIKQIKSPNRDRALGGACNAAWDITYLSEFVRRISYGEGEQQRIIMATADQLLAEIAPLLLLGPEPEESLPSLEEALARWWPKASAVHFCNALFAAAEQAKRRRRWSDEAEDPISRLTEEGEKFLRNWKP